MSSLGAGRIARAAARQVAQEQRRRRGGDWRARDRDTMLTHWARQQAVARGVFRAAALAEAVSWGLLLVGMYLKWIAQVSEIGVQVFGPIHGTLFIVYCLIALATKSVFGWSWRILLLALVAAVPPFATWWFERWALRAGLLGDPDPVAEQSGG
ncbi:DUF3817 domain-containing protein [Ornithinimicrobium cavernae]|uniref:DUF3817 domain-containing protein n=1 Tax=Ornithinimicrobium cavernae TaxID=2666047 RepID=UPI001F3B12B3|nr:DUF3817 domain-containing protein [Ornithinimicrobium cavernae]